MLSQICSKYNSDKDSLGYADIYERLFDRNWKRILEFGVLHGGSLRAWKEWFPGASIHGVDNNQEMDVLSRVGEEEGFRLHFGDVRDEKFMEKLVANVGVVDLLIEDSRHASDGQRNVFDFFKNSIAPGGLLVIEDIPIDHDGVTQTVPEYWLGPVSGKGRFDPSPLTLVGNFLCPRTRLWIWRNDG